MQIFTSKPFPWSFHKVNWHLHQTVMAETSETYIHQKDPIHSMDKMTQIMSFKVRWNALAHLQVLKKKGKKNRGAADCWTPEDSFGAPCRNLGHFSKSAPRSNAKGSAELSGNTDIRKVHNLFSLFRIFFSLIRSFLQGQGHTGSRAYHGNARCDIGTHLGSKSTYQHL